MAYGLMTTSGWLTSDQIIARLDPAQPLHFAHIQEIRRLEREMCRYSNQDCDVLGAALAASRRTEIHPWEQAWVAKHRAASKGNA